MRREGSSSTPREGSCGGGGQPPLRRPLLMSTADKNITGPRKHMAYLCSANRLYKCPCPPINKAHSCVTPLTHEKQIFLQNIGWRRPVGIFILLTTMLYKHLNGESTAYYVSFAKTNSSTLFNTINIVFSFNIWSYHHTQVQNSQNTESLQNNSYWMIQI